jgi:hypothetical protein
LKRNDAPYLDLVLEPIRVCAKYKPKFGQGNKGDGLTVEQFQTLYQADPFYNWFGLDHPMMYAAHKAAGGMTSVYRQIGIGCEKLFRTILRDSLGLSDEDVTWSYELLLPTGKKRTLYLDGRVPLDRIPDKGKRDLFHEWMRKSADQVGVDRKVFATLDGTVLRFGRVTRVRTQNAKTLILRTLRRHIQERTCHAPQYSQHKSMATSCTDTKARSGQSLLASSVRRIL